MTVSFKAPVKSAVVNNAFVSKQANDVKVGQLGLNKASEGNQIFSVQKSVNELFDVTGTGEGDPNAKNYNNNNYVADGDSHKTAIEKLDAQVKNNADTIGDHIGEVTGAHAASAISFDNVDSELVAINVQDAIDEVESRLDTAESDIQAIEDSVGAANGICPLNASTKIDALYLPSYVDDVLEYANLAAFPAMGEDGKIYVAIDTNRTYRWTGTVYVEISASEVISVNGQNNVVVLDADDIAETATRYWSKKNNVTTTAPTVSNDSSQNYSIGSMWYDTVGDTLYICESATIGAAVWQPISGSGGIGGGGSFTWGFSNEIAPMQEIINRFNVYSFGNSDTQELVATINVPSEYVSGQIKIKNLKVIGSGAGNGFIKAQSFLFKDDELTSVSNSHISTNTQLTFSSGNQIKSVELDICDTSFEINSIPVEANNVILVRLYRDFAAETSSISKVSVMQSAASIAFEV